MDKTIKYKILNGVWISLIALFFINTGVNWYIGNIYLEIYEDTLKEYVLVNYGKNISFDDYQDYLKFNNFDKYIESVELENKLWQPVSNTMANTLLGLPLFIGGILVMLVGATRYG